MSFAIRLPLLIGGLCTFLLVLPAGGHSADARSILETAQEKQLERWEGVNVYRVDETLMGHGTQTYHQRFEVTDEAGSAQTLFMPVSRADLTGEACGSARRMTPDELDAYASGLEMTTEATAEGIEDGLEDAGLPRGLLAASGSDPNATFDPRVMLGGGAAMMRAVAESERAAAADPDRAAREATESADHMAQFVESARLVGTETVDGRKAYRLEASGMDQVQEMDDGEYRLHTMTLWVDTEEHVMLRMKMDGDLTQGSETRPISIEQIQSDFRNVPGSRLYEPYRRTLKMTGMLDDAQQAELRQSQQQLAELEQQMAAMPAGQRAMMERMMGSQLEMLRNMASGEGFQMEMIVDAITVNPKSCG